MNILFIHHNFPAQFHKLSELLARNSENNVVFLSLFRRRQDLEVKGVHWVKIENNGSRDLSKISPYEQSMVFADGLLALRKKGFIPHVLHGHANFGTISYSKDIFPSAKQTGFFEWLYSDKTEKEINYTGAQPPLQGRIYQRQCNILSVGALETSDVAITATEWQKAQFPAEYQYKIQAVHNGIDTDFFSPGKAVELPPSLEHLRGKQIITYTARSFEPHRGFMTFYRSIPLIQKRFPEAHIVMVGDEKHTYSMPLPDEKTYLQLMQEEVDVDTSRLHILPMLRYPEYRSILQLSTVHVYLTVPFTTSWSLMESLSCACIVVGSDTPPVQEVITHGYNGLLAAFHSPESVAENVCYALENQEKLQSMRSHARKTILQKYDEKILLPHYAQCLTGGIRA